MLITMWILIHVCICIPPLMTNNELIVDFDKVDLNLIAFILLV